METLIAAAGVYAGLVAGILVLWYSNVVHRNYAVLLAVLCLGVFLPVFRPAAPPEPAAESVAEKSDLLLSRRNLLWLFSQQQWDEAAKIELDLGGLFDQATPPLPQPPLPKARPRGKTLMWHWCSPERRLVTAQDWIDCRGKTSIIPLTSKG